MHDVVNPANEQVIATVPSTSVEQTDEAIARAQSALASWRAVAPGDRADLLRRFSGIVREHNEELARLEVANAGHTIGNARWEANNVANVLNYYAGAPERLFGRQIPVPGGIDITFKEPVGVVGIIVPWNFPMPIAGWGFAPALAAGCTVVMKPAELTPLTAIRLGELALEAGIPEGVLTVLPGKGSVVGQRLVDHPEVRKIVFTGSTSIGEKVMADCAKHIKAVTLELGGKSANIVFADADLERAAATAPSGVFDNAGQDCCARSRILVQRSAYDRFMELLEPAVQGVRVGDPSADSTEMGPLISPGQLQTVRSFVPESASIAFQGSCPEGPGYWFPPTVLTGTESDRAYREEIFGPVVVVVPFDTVDDAIAIANDSDYGLFSYVFGADTPNAYEVAKEIRSGRVGINSVQTHHETPFGGFKMSGIGRDGGNWGLDAYTEWQSIIWGS